MAAAASASRNPGVPFTADLLKDKLVDSSGNNATDIFCPLGGCRCLMLRKGSAKLVKRNAEALAHTAAKPTRAQGEDFPLASPSSSSSSQEGSGSGSGSDSDCWLVTSPLTFENIGFTKGVVSNRAAARSDNKREDEKSKGLALASLPEGASVRYLACADCDCGPLGWHVESKGSDLGRDVDEEIGAGTGAGGAQVAKAKAGPIREFLLAVERCRYKV